MVSQQKLAQTYRAELNELRERIQKEKPLKSCLEVVDVSDLFDGEEMELVQSSPFLPLVVTLELPERIQLDNWKLEVHLPEIGIGWLSVI